MRFNPNQYLVWERKLWFPLTSGSRPSSVDELGRVVFVAGEGDSCNGLIALFFVVQCMFLWKRKLHRDLDQGSTSFLCKYIWSRSPISSQYVQLWFLQPFVKSLVLIEILMTKSLCIQMVLLVFSSVFLWWSFLCYKWEFFVLSMTRHWPHDPNDITNKDHRNWSYPSSFYHTHMCKIQKKKCNISHYRSSVFVYYITGVYSKPPF